LTDTTAPNLTGLTISPSAVDVTTGPASVTLTVSFTDDLSGLSDASAWLIDESGDTVAGSALVGPSTGTSLAGTRSGTLTIPKFSEPGHYAFGLRSPMQS
jgi:hypothetical protein